MEKLVESYDFTTSHPRTILLVFIISKIRNLISKLSLFTNYNEMLLIYFFIIFTINPIDLALFSTLSNMSMETHIVEYFLCV